MPIRRVFGTAVFNVHERVDMPRPGEMRAGSVHLRVLDPAWSLVYGPIARTVGLAATRLNRYALPRRCENSPRRHLPVRQNTPSARSLRFST
jgi:hypothetical protein